MTSSSSAHISAGPGVCSRSGRGEDRRERGKADILTVGGADRIGGIRPEVIRLAKGQAGDVAGEGAGDAGRALRGLRSQRDRGIDRRIPDHAELGRIGHTQTYDSAIPHGRCLRNVRDGLGGDGRRNQRSESDIITVRCAARICGISADMIQRAGCQAGHGAGEGAGRADWAIRGFAICRGRIRRGGPDDAMFSWVG